MLTSDPFQIISLIGFPKPQIFIFSPVLKARCDNTAAVLKQRRPRKQTQRRVRLLRFTKDAPKEMRRRPSAAAGYARNTRTAPDCGGTMVRRGHRIRRSQTVFFFHGAVISALVFSTAKRRQTLGQINVNRTRSLRSMRHLGLCADARLKHQTIYTSAAGMSLHPDL